MEREKIYGQKCQDPELNGKFYGLHKELVDRVVRFCAENSIDIDEFYLHADGISGSVPFGSWQACTDSGFEMYRREDLDKEDPQPYLLSM